MIEGIKEGLIEAITKRSPKLKRDALYERKSAITRLPKVWDDILIIYSYLLFIYNYTCINYVYVWYS